MRHISYLLAVLCLFIVVNAAYAQPKSAQAWQTGNISSDSVAITCSTLYLPSELGRLLIESNPTTVDGELAHALRSSHAVKVQLQPQTGTADTLSSISGCTVDGTPLILSTADTGDVITIPHTPGQIEFPDGVGITIDTPLRIYIFYRKGGKWVMASGSGGSGGGGGNITILDGQKIDMSAVVLNSATEGFFPPRGNSCAQSIGLGQVCLDIDDAIWYVGTGTSIVAVGGPGAGGSGTTAHTAFQLNKVVDSLDGVASAAVFKSTGNAAIRIYGDAQGGVVDCITSYGTTNTACIPREIKTISLGAGAFSPDATLCKYNFNDVINTLIVPVTIECADNDGSTIYINIAMPDRWDGVALKVWSFLHTKETDPNGDIHTDWTGYCVESHGANGAASWAAETANGAMDIDLDAATIVTHDEVITGTVGNVPLSGCTGAGKKSLWLRMQIDAAGTTADDAGAGTALIDQLFTKFVIEYGLKAFTD